MKKQNSRGQFTREMSILITKELQAAADEMAVRIRPIVRDELERTHRANIYASRMPAVNGSYHYTGTLASHVKGVIDGNTAKAVIEEVPYENQIRSEHGATLTTEVYEILKNGSTANPRADAYPYAGKNGEMKWSKYIQQKPHNFEQRTLDDMEVFLENIKSNPELYLKPYLKKYRNKRI
jgi:hypothetical protein